MECPKCKANMVELEFKGEKMSVVSAFRDHLVTPYACPECGYMEFYAEVEN